MAIITCKNCGKKYSDKAPRCPFCTAEKAIQENTKANTTERPPNIKPVNISAIVIIIVIIVVATVSIHNHKKNVRLEAQVAQQQKKEKAQRRAANAQARAEKRKAERLKKEAALTPQQRRKKQIEKAFSCWDGSHRKLEYFIKNAMNNPDSYKHVRTTYTDRGNFILVRTTFRGTNKFNAIVTNTVTAKTDINGNIIEILQQK